MNHTPLQFFPEHPSLEKTNRLATQDSPLLTQSEPILASALHTQFCEDFDGALRTYEDKRFEVRGIASKVGPDGHQKPSVQLSDQVGGVCHVLCVFPSDEVYQQVSVGDTVVIRGNYLVTCNWFGIVMKKCEVVKP